MITMTILQEVLEDAGMSEEFILNSAEVLRFTQVEKDMAAEELCNVKDQIRELEDKKSSVSAKHSAAEQAAAALEKSEDMESILLRSVFLLQATRLLSVKMDLKEEVSTLLRRKVLLKSNIAVRESLARIHRS